MKDEKRGMDAVISKVSKHGRRKMAMKRKKAGDGVAIMIAVGKPKPEMPKDRGMKEELDASKGEGLSNSQKIAALEEKIAYLKAELALLRDEHAKMGEEDEAEDEDVEEDEDEDY